VFSVRSGLSLYIKQTRFVFKGLKGHISVASSGRNRYYLLFSVLAGSSGGFGQAVLRKDRACNWQPERMLTRIGVFVDKIP
jgi:hypothetical protein